MTKRDIRRLSCERTVEFRATAPDEGGDGRTLEGHFAMFNSPTEINSPHEGRFNESIAPGAFRKTIAEKKPLVQYDHGHDTRVGSTPIAAIQDLKEDGKGLFMRARLFDNELVRPVRDAIAGGALNGASFRFTPIRDSWTDARGADVDPDELDSLLYGGRSVDSGRLPLNRVLREVKLHELGPVANPAYTDTAIAVRSDEEVQADRNALLAEYKRTMVPSERSGASDGDNDADDTLEFDHFATDIPVREDGLPDVADPDYEANETDGRAAKDPQEPYGAVKYADPGYQDDKKKRYPLDTKEHADAAWKYINKQANADKYSSGDLAKVKAAIKTAAKKFGIAIDDEKSSETTGAERTALTPENETDAVTKSDTSEYRSGLLDAGFTAEEADAMLGIAPITDAALSGTSDIPENTRKVVSMKTQEEFEARQAEIAERLKSLMGETRDQSLTGEQDTEWETLVAERKVNAAALDKIADRRAFVESLAADDTKTERGADAGRKAPAFHAERDVYDVTAIERSTMSVGTDRAADLWIEAGERAIEKAKFAPAPTGYKGKRSDDVAAELLQTVADGGEHLAKRMIVTGSPAYERAYKKFLQYNNDAFMDNEERQAWARAQTLGTNTSGGFAIPFQLDPTIILTNAGTVNPIRQLAKTIHITGKEYDFVTSAGATATRGAEAAPATDGSIVLAQPTVRTNRVQVFIPFSYEADMAWNNIRAELTEAIVDAKDREEDSFWTGNGTGTAPQGVVGYAATAGVPNVSSVASGAFAAVDVHNLYDALPPRFENNAVWAANKAIYGSIRQFDTAGGAELWARIGDGQPPTLLDQRAVRVSALPGTAAVAHAGGVYLVLGDFSKFVIVDRVGMNVELIPQVFATSGSSTASFPTGQRGLYATWMNNSVLLVPSAFATLQSV